MKRVEVKRETIDKVSKLYFDILEKICRIEDKIITFYICKQVIMKYDTETFILKYDYSKVEDLTFKRCLFEDMLDSIDFDIFKQTCSHGPTKDLTYCEALALLALVFAHNQARIIGLFK